MNLFCLDIGGSKIKYALFDEQLQFLERGETPSEAADGAEKLLENIYAICDRFEFDALGVSTAGMVAPDGSIFYANENIPRYTGVPLRALLENRYHVPAEVLNDIAAAAYAQIDGEMSDDFYFLALGTGVGGMHVKNGVLQRGAYGVSGQIGYLPSLHGDSIIDKAASALGLKRASGEDAETLLAKAEQGDPHAQTCLRAWCDEVAHLLAHIVGFVNPREIILGGGISENGEKLLKAIRNNFSILPEPYRKTVILKTATHKNASGVLGMAKYCKEKWHEKGI